MILLLQQLEVVLCGNLVMGHMGILGYFFITQRETFVKSNASLHTRY